MCSQIVGQNIVEDFMSQLRTEPLEVQTHTYLYH